jgi:hypothetical protein
MPATASVAGICACRGIRESARQHPSTGGPNRLFIIDPVRPGHIKVSSGPHQPNRRHPVRQGAIAIDEHKEDQERCDP